MIPIASKTFLLFSLLLLGLVRVSEARAFPYQNQSLAFEQRVHDLVSRMTFDEKILQMQNEAPAIPHLGIPSYNWWNEALHGVAANGISTVFPQAIGMAAAWDRDLHFKVATAISDEGRAKFHEAQRQGQRGQYQGISFWSPNINIFRDPRWGRGQETYGEDPYLTGELGVQFVKGLQGNDPKYFKTIATPKHFVAHSGPEQDRFAFNSQVSEHDLRDTYLRAFEKAIREGGAYSTMSSYNAINGVPAPANPRILDQILRKEWGFQGYVVSDCGAVGAVVWNHHYTNSLSEAAAVSVRAGTDLTCGGEYASLKEALRLGLITEGEVTQAVSRLMMARMKLGMFDTDVSYAEIPFSVVDSPEHRALAKEVAIKSIVLLKNDNFLPLKKNLKNVAVIGPNANDSAILLGDYSGTPSQSVTPFQGIKDKLPGASVVYAKGSDRTSGNSSDLNSAVELAKHNDVAILVLGLSLDQENENLDRNSIELPPAQEQLLKAVVATGTPTVLVLAAGSAVVSTWADKNVKGILSAWYPGEEGGSALADILFGDANPSARTPVTYYKSSSDLPALTDYSMSNRTYRYFKGEVLYPFGFGLSYTKFKYSHLQIENSPLKLGQDLSLKVDIQNLGDREAEEVVEVYLRNEKAASYMPTRALVQFGRVSLKAHETKTVSLQVRSDYFSYFDTLGYNQLQPGSFVLSVGGKQPQTNEPQNEDNLLMTRLQLVQ